MERIQYTGTNYEEVRRFCGERVMAPYFCMGFSMLTVETAEGWVSVHEGDYIEKDASGILSVA